MKRYLTDPRYLWVLLAMITTIGAICWMAGCASVAKFATDAAEATGHISEEEANSLHHGIDAVDLTFKGINPRQEYFIGRAVAATILKSGPLRKCPPSTTAATEPSSTSAYAQPSRCSTNENAS